MSKQDEILGVIIEFKRNKGYSPTYQEIADEVGIVKSGVSYHLNKLQAAGKINFLHRDQRTITILKQEN